MRAKSVVVQWRDAILSADADLDSKARLVACVLAKHMDRDGGSCYPSIALIAKEASLSRASICRALQDLKTQGWLEVKAGGGTQPNKYRARFPDHVSQWETGLAEQPLPVSEGDSTPLTVRPKDAHRGRPKKAERRGGRDDENRPTKDPERKVVLINLGSGREVPIEQSNDERHYDEFDLEV